MESTHEWPARICIVFHKTDDPNYPVLPLTGTEREIREDYEFFLSRHPELTEENFVEFRRRHI